MPTLNPNFSYVVSNTYVTDSGEGRIDVVLKYTTKIKNENNEVVNTEVNIAEFYFGVGSQDPATANVENLIYNATPQYFIE
jgi:hypothetical protein